MNRSFYKNKKIFITGSTGFKGTWLCKALLMFGADVYGYSLEPTEEQKLFDLSGIKKEMKHYFGDIRDLEFLKASVMEANPEVVIHLAAQPLVRKSYLEPVNTYSTNVMGTVNLLEACRACNNLRSVINVTTDKVYYNKESTEGYEEEDILNGYDPYSNSKSCSELVTDSYKKSFFRDKDVAISTCRAGNVIGGGDFATDRIIPDCYRAASKSEKIIIRNPDSVRPYQHVLEPVLAYLLLAQKQFIEKGKYEGAYNIGPNEDNYAKTSALVELFCKEWKGGADWKVVSEQNAVHEANLLYLNCNKIKNILQWKPAWNIEKTINKTVEWYQVYHKKGDIKRCMEKQIQDYLEDSHYEV